MNLLRNILLILAILAAIIGPVSQHGKANWITYASVAPIVLFGLLMLFKAGGGKTNIVQCSALPALLLFVPAAGLPVLLWAIGLLALAYVAKAAVDNLTHQAGNSIFERWGAWFDARTSWKNKYRAYDADDLRARFPLATTVLVLLTDFWHAADSVYLTAYLLGGMLLGAWLGPVGALPWVLAVVGVKAVGGGVFQACYRFFRVSKSA